MALRVLLIEDDASLASAIENGLRDAGVICRSALDVESVWREFDPNEVDVIILDLMLGAESGLDVLQKIRERRYTTPVLILTAFGSLEDRVKGLNMGADDYMVKPFEMPELLARLSALTRRSRRIEGTTLTYGPLRLELTTRRAFRDGKELGLSPTELVLIELFMRRAETVLTRQMLCEQLWDESWQGATNVIEVHINRLRGKVDRGFDQSLIQTVRGRGYLLTLQPSSDKRKDSEDESIE